MKKIPLFACLFIVFSLFLIMSCARKAAPPEFDYEGFNRALTHVYDTFGSFGGATRAYDFSDPADWDAYMEELEMLISWLQDIAEEYGIAETVENSPYYKNTGMFAALEADGFSESVRLEFIDANATPEFKRLYAQVMNDISEFGIDYVIENSDLLPNEKLAFATCLAMYNDPENISTRSSGDCENKYIRAMNKCRDKAAGRVLLCMLGGCIPGGQIISFGALIGVLMAESDCYDNARAEFKNCKANEVSPPNL